MWFRPRRGTSRDTVLRYVTAPRYHYKGRLNELVWVFCPNQPNYEYFIELGFGRDKGTLIVVTVRLHRHIRFDQRPRQVPLLWKKTRR